MKDKETNKKVEKFQPLRFQKMTHHGINIQIQRALKGLSQTQLAEKCNLSQQAISNYEKTETLDDETIKTIADALEIDPRLIKESSIDSGTNIFVIDNKGEGSTITNGGCVFELNHNTYIYPIDKICLVYDKMVEKLENENTYLRSDISELKSKIEELVNKIK